VRFRATAKGPPNPENTHPVDLSTKQKSAAVRVHFENTASFDFVFGTLKEKGCCQRMWFAGNSLLDGPCPQILPPPPPPPSPPLPLPPPPPDVRAVDILCPLYPPTPPSKPPLPPPTGPPPAGSPTCTCPEDEFRQRRLKESPPMSLQEWTHAVTEGPLIRTPTWSAKLQQPAADGHAKVGICPDATAGPHAECVWSTQAVDLTPTFSRWLMGATGKSRTASAQTPTASPEEEIHFVPDEHIRSNSRLR
jgi:hypothetical protein